MLEVLFPELGATRHVRQPSRYHVHDVHGHLLATVHEMDRVLAGRADFEISPEVEHDLNQPVGDGLTRRHLMGLAALLHDIGKPQTVSLRPDGEPQFLGHEDSGACAVGAICRRLKFSRAVRIFLVGVVKNHMRPFTLAPESVSLRAIRRFRTRTGCAAHAVLLLHLADLRGARGDMLTSAEYDGHVRKVDYLTSRFSWLKRSERAPRLVTGRDVLELDVQPGPRIGAILSRMDEAQDTGEVATREQAIDLLARVVAE